MQMGKDNRVDLINRKAFVLEYSFQLRPDITISCVKQNVVPRTLNQSHSSEAKHGRKAFEQYGY